MLSFAGNIDGTKMLISLTIFDNYTKHMILKIDKI